MESLPPELDLDDFRIARALTSPDTVVRRLGVQSVIIRRATTTTSASPTTDPTPLLPPLSSGDKDKHDKSKKDPKDTA
jgi:hypothetical protein